jgi:hypothetical protein
MTTSLQQAFQMASILQADQQEALAAVLLEELESERQWQAAFDASQDALGKLADEALAEHRQGKTRDLDELL